jgi:hypothetical protein
MRLQTPARLVGGLALLLSLAGAAGQGTFQNLDFESGTFIPIAGDPYGQVVWASAMPGWTGYLGTNQTDRIARNGGFLDSGGMTIDGPDFTPNWFHGHYYIQLQSGLDPGGSGQFLVPTIAQTGMVPLLAQSFQLYAYAAGFTVTFAGKVIPMSVVGGSSSTYYIYGGDISGFAGQTGELRLRGGGFFDYFQFSNLPVPEPGVFSLSALGALLLGWRIQGRRR